MAQDADWPIQLDVSEGQIVIYQPQPDGLEGDILKARSAVAFQPQGKSEPVFGAIWFESQVDIDRDARTVNIDGVKVEQVRITDAAPGQEQRIASILERDIGDLQATLDYDSFVSGLAALDQEPQASQGLNNNPPKILFETEPAILVVCDGEPELSEMGDSGLMRVINTPFYIVLDPGTRRYWLNGGTSWFSSKDIKGDWQMEAKAPRIVDRAYQEDLKAVDGVEIEPEAAQTNVVPKIILATEPTELIVSMGKPRFSQVPDSQLLYMTNTEDDVFLDIANMSYYVLLSGRWFKSGSMEGPWQYVPGDGLPNEFAAIPEDWEKSNVLPFVAGTAEADQALADAAIPQTAAIKRSEAKFAAVYDGEPDFEPIPDTPIEAASNTYQSILYVDDRYYACDDAVWFVADSPYGPWFVSDFVPPQVQYIPPQSRYYPVRYVHVYRSTPDVVYVGYTPGYLGCYRDHGTIVYGTGYRYRPYRSRRVYYPRASTWGYHANYNPWTGWSFGMSWSVGWTNFSIGFGHDDGHYRDRGHHYGRGHRGWWGPGGYRWRPNHNYHRKPVTIHRPMFLRSGDVDLTKRLNNNRRLRVRPEDRRGWSGLYRHGNRRKSLADRDRRQTRPEKRKFKPAKRPNDVVADRKGNILRRDRKGKWQERAQGKWKPVSTDRLKSSRTDWKQLDRLPMTRPGTKPTWKPIEQQPGTKPARKPGTKPTWKPIEQQPGTKPARKPEKKPTWKPIEQQPGTKPTWKPIEQQPGTKPARKPEKKPTWKPIEQQPGTKPTWKPIEQQPGTKPARKPEKKPTWKPIEQQPGTKPARKPEKKPTWKPIEQQPVTKPARKPEKKPTWKPIERQPATKPARKPEKKPTWKPIEQQPVTKPARKPEKKPTWKPIERQPATKPARKPEKKPTWKPIERQPATKPEKPRVIKPEVKKVPPQSLDKRGKTDGKGGAPRKDKNGKILLKPDELIGN